MAAGQLVVRLVRGTAGKKKTMLRTLDSLGFRKSGETKVFENTPAVRGALQKVIHLVQVSTMEQEKNKVEEMRQKLKTREPITVKHV
mmetsp:Transcript_15316/g.38979  ORF Transcript_15316/g.38979 Transcript_15316/m.38979 type:complete len:87 (+) Transcript_15316:30-290(+)